jgi:hypothetical protein
MAHKKTLIPLDGDNLGMNLKLLRFWKQLVDLSVINAT